MGSQWLGGQGGQVTQPESGSRLAGMVGKEQAIQIPLLLKFLILEKKLSQLTFRLSISSSVS